MPIILYDISSSLPRKAFSPPTWKVRYCLNYKSIEHQTIWLEYPDIEPTLKKLGIVAKAKKADGSPWYNLPAIHDPATGVSLAGSFTIIEYLERTYPAPSVFPFNTITFQTQFERLFTIEILKPFLRASHPSMVAAVSPISIAYLEQTAQYFFGAEHSPSLAINREDDEANWNAVKRALGTVKSWYEKAGGPFIMGPTVSCADFTVASWLICLREINGKKWEDVSSWHDGRWNNLLKALEKQDKAY